MLRSRLPKIAAGLPLVLDVIAREGAEQIEAGAKDRVPVASGRLRDAIHVERQGRGEYAVVAGDNEAYYGHIVEHGSVHMPPHPFLTPAGEEAKAAIGARARAALKAL